jgi:hypothetical protein
MARTTARYTYLPFASVLRMLLYSRRRKAGIKNSAILDMMRLKRPGAVVLSAVFSSSVAIGVDVEASIFEVSTVADDVMVVDSIFAVFNRGVAGKCEVDIARVCRLENAGRELMNVGSAH